MKKIFNIFSLLMVTLLGLSLAACSEKDEFGTNQYQAGVHLNVFGPSPVMRGGELRFLGSNLDQIKEVQIPGVASITNIEVVKSGVPSEIRVTVPKDGPTPGKVKLITNTGVEIETQTPLAYKEPIEIESVTASAMPGDVIEIKGDYLNLIHMVEFADGVWVSEKAFTEHTRYVIKLKVPEDARTGKLGLYDMDLTAIEGAESDVTYNIIMTETALNVGTPTVSKIASPRGEVAANGTVVAKKGETITITGKNFNLTDYVMFANDTKIVEIGELEISKDGTTITLPLPAEAPDGDITIVCKSGIDIPVGTLQTVKPTELVATPNPVKNGQALTIKGKDLDVVVVASFTAILDGANVDVAVEPSSTTELTVVVPEAAADGDLTLHMQNGATVTVPYTLVKPTVTAYSSNPVSAGGALSINGTDLDLVKTVVFNGSAEPIEIESDGTIINLTVPMDAQSGAVTLNLKNGAEVTVMDINVEEAVFCYAKALPTSDDEIHAGETLTLEVANIDKLTSVQINGTDCQYICSGSKLIIGVPDNAKKGAKVTLISSNGQITYTVDFIPNTEITTYIWKGMKECNWSGSLGEDNKAITDLSWGGYDWSSVTEGTTLEVTFTPTSSDWACIAPIDGSWNQIFDKKQYDFFTLDPQVWSVDLTADMLNKLVNNGGLVLSGANIVYSSVKLIEHISLETVLWAGEFNQQAWTNWEVGKGTYGDSNPNMFTEAGIKTGQTIRVYVTPTNPDWWQFQMFDGHWGGLADLGEATGLNNGNNINSSIYSLVNGAIEIPVTASIAEKFSTLTDWGMCCVIQCENLIVTKITIE